MQVVHVAHVSECTVAVTSVLFQCLTHSLLIHWSILFYVFIFRLPLWRLRGNIIRTALCWIVWHNVHNPQHTYMSISYRSNRLGLSHWDPYAVRRGGCLELYYCNMVEWFWWDSSLISTTNWFPSVLWHCWFGHQACKNRPRNDLLCVEWDTLNPKHSHFHLSLSFSKYFSSAPDLKCLSAFCVVQPSRCKWFIRCWNTDAGLQQYSAV